MISHAALPHEKNYNDPAEGSYWLFDAKRKGYGQWRGNPMSERDAFKAEYRIAASRVVRVKSAPADSDERKYPCAKCGLLRSKAEGGTTFTVCDTCWDATRAAQSPPATPEPRPDFATAAELADVVKRIERWEEWLLALPTREAAIAAEIRAEREARKP